MRVTERATILTMTLALVALIFGIAVAEHPHGEKHVQAPTQYMEGF